MLAVRLVPILPFTAINYAAGPAGVRRRDFLIGSAVGMVPGSIAYAAVGAFGTHPLGLGLALAALVALVVVGGVWGRRILARPPTTATGPDPAEADPRRAVDAGPEQER